MCKSVHISEEAHLWWRTDWTSVSDVSIRYWAAQLRRMPAEFVLDSIRGNVEHHQRIEAQAAR